MLFADRHEAGRELAQRLVHHAGDPVVVLGLPRGGVPVAFEVARAWHAPMDVLLVRKLGVPFQPELGMGGIGEGGVRVLDDETVRLAGVSGAELAAVEERERIELERRAQRYRGGRERISLEGRVALIVDDGIATGSTARAACRVARAAGAARVVLAVPVAPRGWEARIGDDADQCIALATPYPFRAVGQFYRDFAPTSDDEVIDCLASASAAHDPPAPASSVADDPRREEDVVVLADGVRLAGTLVVPDGATGIVVFAHGSGSSRHSPRNRFVAEVLVRAGLATLLFDLLSVQEERDRRNVFDVELLGRRLVDVTRWVRAQPDVGALPVGYFGASTGAAAALWAASELGCEVAAVVSRGGRPDLAGGRLRDVTAPTLLVVGGDDRQVLALNRDAAARLRCPHELAVVPGATHLFEEPGTLFRAADLARGWFVDHLGAAGGAR